MLSSTTSNSLKCLIYFQVMFNPFTALATAVFINICDLK